MLPSNMPPPPMSSSAFSSTNSSASASKTSLASPAQQRVFDIDHHLNPYLPRRRLHLLPRPIAHFLGHRRPHPYPPLPTSISTLLALIGAFTGVAVAIVVLHNIPPFSHSSDPVNPVTIASLGATAILLYAAPQSPLAQPRPLLLGHGIAAIIGILITMAFKSLGPDEFSRLTWLSGALAVAISAALMSITKSVHPPAGATALLAVTSPEITKLRWGFLALVLLGCVVMLIVALLWGNVHVSRRFPHFWWTEMDLGKDEDDVKDVVEMEEEGRRGDEERVIVLPRDFVLSEEECAVIARIEERIASNQLARRMTPEIMLPPMVMRMPTKDGSAP